MARRRIHNISPNQWSTKVGIIQHIVSGVFEGVPYDGKDKTFVTDYLKSCLSTQNTATEMYLALPEQLRPHFPPGLVSEESARNYAEFGYTRPKLSIFEDDFLELIGKYATLRALGVRR